MLLIYNTSCGIILEVCSFKLESGGKVSAWETAKLLAAEENPNIGKSDTLSTIKQLINIGIKLIKGDRAAIEKKLNLYERSFKPTTNGIFGASKLQFVRSEYDVIKAKEVSGEKRTNCMNALRDLNSKVTTLQGEFSIIKKKFDDGFDTYKEKWKKSTKGFNDNAVYQGVQERLESYPAMVEQCEKDIVELRKTISEIQESSNDKSLDDLQKCQEQISTAYSKLGEKTRVLTNILSGFMDPGGDKIGAAFGLLYKIKNTYSEPLKSAQEQRETLINGPLANAKNYLMDTVGAKLEALKNDGKIDNDTYIACRGHLEQQARQIDNYILSDAHQGPWNSYVTGFEDLISQLVPKLEDIAATGYGDVETCNDQLSNFKIRDSWFQKDPFPGVEGYCKNQVNAAIGGIGIIIKDPELKKDVQSWKGELASLQFMHKNEDR